MTSLKRLLTRLAQGMTAPASYAGRRDSHTREFLRWIMVFMVAGLALSIVLQRIDSAHDCFQGSISAYWYTPARSIFVGGLMSIGVCLLCTKGKTAAEDAMLNFAGVLAPVVALVPTPPPGSMSCDIPAGQGLGRDVLVENNLPAIYLVGGLALLLVLWLVTRSTVRFTKGELAGYGLAAAVWAASFTVFLVYEDAFLRYAHYTAAVGMFAAIILVVLINATLTRQAASTWNNRYTWIFVLMVGSSIGVGALAAAGWDHAILAIEVMLIGCFAVFWIGQTSESHRDMQSVVTGGTAADAGRTSSGAASRSVPPLC